MVLEIGAAVAVAVSLKSQEPGPEVDLGPETDLGQEADLGPERDVGLAALLGQEAGLHLIKRALPACQVLQEESQKSPNVSGVIERTSMTQWVPYFAITNT